MLSKHVLVFLSSTKNEKREKAYLEKQKRYKQKQQIEIVKHFFNYLMREQSFKFKLIFERI